MYEVTFWYDGVEKTMPDTFDTFADAVEWARDRLNYRNVLHRYVYDEALVMDATDYSATFVTRDNVSATF